MCKKKIVKILVISDIHFGKGDDKKLFDELNQIFFKKINELKTNLDFLIIAGDLFDRIIKMNEETSFIINKFISRLVKLSKEYKFKIRILKGTKSHDFNQLENFNYLINDNFKIINTVESEMIEEDLCFLYLPEEYQEDFDSYYKDYFDTTDGKYDFVFFHGTFDFAAYANKIITSERNIKNSITFKSKELKDIAYGKIVGGHIHIRDNFEDKIFYTGSFSRFSFGEDISKGFYIFDYNKETCETNVEFVENNLAPEFVSISFSQLEGKLEDKIETINKLKEAYDNIKIEFTEKEQEELNASLETLKNIDDPNIKISVNREINDEVNTKYEFILKKEYDLETTIQKYIEMEMNVKIDKDTIKKAIS